MVDFVLLGHWIEVKSVMGASRALEQLAKLMPSDAHKLADGSVKDVPLGELAVDDKVPIKPGEKFPRTVSSLRARARSMKRSSPENELRRLVDTVLGRITGKARCVQEKANDTNEINKRRERECKKVQKI